MKKKLYHETKIRPLVTIIANLVRQNPGVSDDELRMQIGDKIEGFWDEKKCVNCDASMAEYAQVLDVNDALLIVRMAALVRRRTAQGIPFTEANRIRVSSEPSIGHTQKCRTTKCSKLRLIAKAKNAHWAITDVGWAAMRGEPVPKTRVTFRGQILERPEETTTFSAVFGEHSDKMRRFQERKGKPHKDDHREAYAEYSTRDWVHVAGYNPGELFGPSRQDPDAQHG